MSAGHNSSATDGQLASYVRRIETLNAEIKDLNDDKSSIFKELKGDGFDVKVVRKLIARRAAGEAATAEQDSILSLYEAALTRAHTRGEGA